MQVTPSHDNTLKRCFAPVVDQRTRLLILGSLPGEASLAQQQYYAHPQNQFWKLASDLIQHDLTKLNYEVRLQTLLRHQIGLWDVVAQAHRRGSLDSQIRQPDQNDLLHLLTSLPHLRAIGFNGATASKIGLKTLQNKCENYELYHLPSSSPAYTLGYAQKRSVWMTMQSALVERS
ncbi:DNA-deoxyinosine glycosylase [Undibacterium sp. FT137W]|uniref:DNA-deoxyinosine glycosylase n=1 Tax=Undibacterium fentianense TaxID=2828728 RepID=A0A941IG50_9BURK|nr:DNA-deoxyinosine glycosylase [Undibacterium fentianense]